MISVYEFAADVDDAANHAVAERESDMIDGHVGIDDHLEPEHFAGRVAIRPPERRIRSKQLVRLIRRQGLRHAPKIAISRTQFTLLRAPNGGADV